jgi:hypothetical protein
VIVISVTNVADQDILLVIVVLVEEQVVSLYQANVVVHHVGATVRYVEEVEGVEVADVVVVELVSVENMVKLLNSTFKMRLYAIHVIDPTISLTCGKFHSDLVLIQSSPMALSVW